MAIPQLSAEERQAALEKAKAARIKRAQVRDDPQKWKAVAAGRSRYERRSYRWSHEGLHAHRNASRLWQGQG